MNVRVFSRSFSLNMLLRPAEVVYDIGAHHELELKHILTAFKHAI